MMTRIFRLIVGFVVIALVVAAICVPPAVQSVLRPVFVDVPTNLTVTAVSNSSITLSWNAVSGGSTFYELERSESMAGPFVNAGAILNQTSITDTDVSPQRAYVYRVRALQSVGSQNVVSVPSNMAVGTAISFEFNQLQGQRIRAQHVYDVRTAINAVRFAANMPAANWARPILDGLTIRASDIQELRNRLNEALSLLQIPVLSYQDPILGIGANGTPIRAVHFEQLQARSTRGSSNSAGPLNNNNPSRALAGEFGGVIWFPLVPVHLSVLPDRRILFWGRDMIFNRDGELKQAAGRSEAYVWNMADGQFQHVPNYTTNLFCSGHSFLPDGNLFVTGGRRSPHFDAAGEKHTNIFNYSQNSWTLGPPMNQGRWYPYNVMLGTGEPLVMAGSYWTDEPPPPYQPYDRDIDPPANPGFAVNLVPQIYTPAPGGGFRNHIEPPQNRLTVYPYLHLTSAGKIFQAQSGFSFPGIVDHQSRLLDPVANQWTQLPSTLFPHAIGSSAFLGNNRFMLVGGFANNFMPTKEVESINLSVGQPSWMPLQSMRFPRTYHTATVLPDGKVLVTGGVSCPGSNNLESYDQSQVPICSGGQVLTPELWDPQTGQWTLMDAHQEVRAYHSVAALLPDGRVLVGGGGLPGAVGEIANGNPITNLEQDHARLFGHTNVEIYSPPYLFDANGNAATRPEITSAPGSVTYGERFFIGTSLAGSQPKASLVRLPSVTHGFNQDQRQIFLDNPVAFGGGIFVTVPTSGNDLPPGYYMLFVLNSAGVPSLAEIVRVQNSSLFPTAAPDAAAPGEGDTWEQGIEFSSTVSGYVSHVRFWKAPGEPSGGHVGHIWTASGIHLGSAQFVNETASGWQEAPLQAPVQITANVRYKVTYNIHSIVAKRFDALHTPITSGPLIGWGSSFSKHAGSFPVTGSASNFFADVKFK